MFIVFCALCFLEISGLFWTCVFGEVRQFNMFRNVTLTASISLLAQFFGCFVLEKNFWINYFYSFYFCHLVGVCWLPSEYHFYMMRTLLHLPEVQITFTSYSPYAVHGRFLEYFVQMRIYLCFVFWAEQLLHFNNDRTWLGNCKNSCEHICNKERSVSFLTTNASFPLWKSHVFQDLKLLQL